MRLHIGLSTRITLVVLVLVMAGGLMWIDKENDQLQRIYLSDRSADLETALHIEKVRQGQAIEMLRQDALFLASTPPISGIVRASANFGLDARDKDTYATWEARLQEIFSAFLRAHPDYYQIRYIGAAGEGMELVRVERRNGRVEVAPQEALQAKGDRDYFRAGLMLTAGRVHLSGFNLNQDQTRPEDPRIPTLRAVTTVFDASGHVFGMVVINKDLRPLFESSATDLPLGVQTFIADQHGYYLQHPDAKRAFEFESGSIAKITGDFPSLAPMFEPDAKLNKLPFHAVSGAGYLAAERVFFDASDPSRFLLLAYLVPEQMVLHQAAGIPLSRILLAALITLAVSAAFMLMLRHTFAPLKRIAAAAMEIAEGNRSIRLEHKGGGELGELADALNIMLDKLMSTDQLERENAFRKELIESLPGIFYMLDAQGRLLMWNRNLEQVLKCTAEELHNCPILEFFRGEHKVAIENAIQQALELGSASVEAVLRDKDGAATPYQFTGRFVLRGEMPVVIGLGRDISAQKRAEEELLVAAATFETHDGILITDAQANIIRVNRAFTEITGYSADEVIGKNPGMMRSGRHDQAFYAEMWQQLLATGSWAGEIWDRRKNGEIFPKWMTITAVKNTQGETVQYVAIFSDITRRKQEEEEMRSLAFYDPLTHLPNRRLFLERFQAALASSARYGDQGALLFIDLDNFKQLNDSQGHDCGDLLLVEVAVRIKSCVREIDAVARLGGDEFVVLLDSLGSVREDAALKAGLVAEKVRETLTQPYHLKECEHYSSPSIGIKLFRGDAESLDELLKCADSAMYQAKSAGRNAVRYYDPDLQRYWESMAGGRSAQ